MKKTFLMLLALLIAVTSACKDEGYEHPTDVMDLSKITSSLPSAASDLIDTLVFTVVGLHSTGGDSVLQVPSVHYNIDSVENTVYTAISVITKDHGLQKYAFTFVMAGGIPSVLKRFSCTADGCSDCDPPLITKKPDGKFDIHCGLCYIETVTCNTKYSSLVEVDTWIDLYSTSGINAITNTNLNIPTKLLQMEF